mgnify:CR=1 FL=1
MNAFFGIVGILGFLLFWIFLILYLVALFKHDKINRKLFRNWTLGMLATMFVCIIGLGATDGSSDSSKDNNVKVTESHKKKPAKKHVSKPKKSTEPASDDSAKQEMALQVIKKNYKGIAKVWYDKKNKMYMIQPTGDEFREELIECINENNKKEWHEATNGIDALSKAIYEKLGLKDESVSIVNPDRPDKVLYTSMDGLGAYDFMDDNK